MTERQHLQVPGASPAAGADVDWSLVWDRVATTVAGHLAAGRGHLVTQDTVRLAAVLALQALGVAPTRMSLGWTGGNGGPGGVAETTEPLADLLLDGPGGTLVDVRLPWAVSAAHGSEAIGWLLRDLLRVASVPAEERWVGVARLAPADGAARPPSPSAAGCPGQRTRRPGCSWTAPGWTRSPRERPARWVPAAGRSWSRSPAPVPGRSLPSWTSTPSRSPCWAQVPTVRPRPDADNPAERPAAPVAAQGDPPARAGRAPPSPRGTARAEVLAAVRAVVARTGTDVVHEQQVLDEVRRSGARFDQATVLTMLTRHMCAQVQGRGVASYDDVDQVDEHHYRLRPGR